MEKQRFQWDTSKLIISICCFAVMIIFWLLPAPEPLTPIGMKVIGVFIGTVVLLSAVNTVWPAILAVVLLSLTGVVNLNGAIAGTLGGWVVYFVLMSFIMTYALNESGFTSRLVAKFMSQKFVSKSPWTFTISLGVLGMILGAFIDQVPAAAFMLAFNAKIYQELGYTEKDKYPHIANIFSIFGVNIGGAMTPISHSLIILGLGVYEGATGQTISLFNYLIYGIPTGIILFVLMSLIFRYTAKADFSKFENFDVNRVLDKQGPMTLKEKSVVTIFFLTVAMWIIPGILKMIAPASDFVVKLNSYSITFWAILAVVVLAVVCINKEPLINIKEVVNHNINWAILIFIAIGCYFGSALCDEATGVNAFMAAKVAPLTANVSPIIVVLIIAFATVLMTNFASNVSTITVMTTVGVGLAMSTGNIGAAAIAMVTSFCGSAAYLMPSSFAITSSAFCPSTSLLIP